MIVSCFRWTKSDGGHEFQHLIPEGVTDAADDEPSQGADVDEAGMKPRRKMRTLTNKGALYTRYNFQVHCFLAHLRRVHPKLPPTMMEIAKVTVERFQ